MGVNRVTRRLLASVHDVTPVHAARLDLLVPMLEAAVGPGRFALLVVPDFHGEAPLRAATPFARRLRAWADAGCELFLHGYTHRDDQAHRTATARFKARWMTAGEGEFLGLDYAEAVRRLRDGRALVEDVTGHEVAGFVAPAWLYGPPSLAALADLDFALAEDHLRVWRPQSGTVVARGPVISYSGRTRARALSSIAWSQAATRLLRNTETVRLAVHPHDLDQPAIVREIERALRSFAGSHAASAYRGLADCGAGRAKALRQGRGRGGRRPGGIAPNLGPGEGTTHGE